MGATGVLCVRHIAVDALHNRNTRSSGASVGFGYFRLAPQQGAAGGGRLSSSRYYGEWSGFLPYCSPLSRPSEDFVNRTRLTIGACSETDNFLNADGGGRTVCHHLLVTNHMPSRPVENCRVWLVKILDQNAQGKFDVEFQFAVPRLMEWAPSEYSPDVRSFSEDQVFDFGRSYVDKGPFVVNVFKGQGGAFKGDCDVGKSRQYVFRITADNYIKAKTVKVQVDVTKVERTEAWPHGFRTRVGVKGRWKKGAILSTT